MARPEPLSPVGAPTEGAGAAVATGIGPGATVAPPQPAAAAPSPSEAEQFFAPAVLQPVTHVPPADSRSAWSPTSYGSAGTSSAGARDTIDTGKWILLGGVVLFIIAAVATAYVTFGSAAKNHPAP